MKKQSAGRRVRREKIRRKKMQVREKVGKSRNTVFFRGFVAPEGWKVGSLKRRVRRHLGRWEMKSCTPLWREAHLEVKCVKNWGFGPLLEVEMLKKCTLLWREAYFQVKMHKTHQVRTTFGSWDVEKVHAVVARSTFRSQNIKSTRGSGHFLRFRCRFASLHYTTLHYTTLHYTTLHYTTLRYTTLHYTTLHSATLQLQLHNYTPLH